MSPKEYGDEVVVLDGRVTEPKAINGRFHALKNKKNGSPAYYNKRGKIYLYRHVGGWGWAMGPALDGGLCGWCMDGATDSAASIKADWNIWSGGWAVDNKISIVAGSNDVPEIAEAVRVICRFENVNGGYRKTAQENCGAAVFFNEEDNKYLWCDGPRWKISDAVASAAYFIISEETKAWSPEGAAWDHADLEEVDLEAGARNFGENETYTDADFPPNDSSLGKDFGGQEWVRGTSLGGISEPKLFDKIEPNDIMQGALGNCWLLAASAALAEFPMYLATQVFQDKTVTEDGAYTLNLYDVNEGWIDVKIDDFIPCAPKKWYEPASVPLFSQPNGNELYMLLLEKAFAKFAGSYNGLETGFESLAWLTLTGEEEQLTWILGSDGNWDKHVIDMEKMKADPRNFQSMALLSGGESKASVAMWQYALECDQNNYVVAAAIPGVTVGKPRPDGLVELHAYSMLACREVDGNKLVQLRNPWGNAYEWKGAWGDSSPEWSNNPKIWPALKAQLGLSEQESSDGTFFMNWADFTSIFTRLQICPMDMGVKRGSHNQVEQAKLVQKDPQALKKVRSSDRSGDVQLWHTSTSDCVAAGKLTCRWRNQGRGARKGRIFARKDGGSWVLITGQPSPHRYTKLSVTLPKAVLGGKLELGYNVGGSGNQLHIANGVITIEETSGMDNIVSAFNAYDTNGDGMITEAEMTDILTSLGDKDFSEAAAAQLFAAADKSSDGKLSVIEFVKWLEGV